MTQYYYKTKIQYIGTNYAGFQWQNGTTTVQSDLNDAIAKLLPEKFSTTAASRTDTGVHAREQYVKITSATFIELSLFLENLNKTLPSQIRCLSIEPCSGEFRPSSQSISKEYRYFFTNKTQVSEQDRQFIANISNPLNIEAMKICIKALLGPHDFCNYYSSGSNVKSTTRNIFACELSEINPQIVFSKEDIFHFPDDLPSCFELRIVANGFLKQMIRHIVSALWMVGSGKISTDDFLTYLNGPKMEKQLWKVASPNGLFLYQINY